VAAMFSLDHQAATLDHVNIRKEQHGDDEVLAVDLKFSVPLSCTELAMFHPSLRHCLYDSQASKTGESAAIEATNLRFPDMKPIGWELELENQELSFEKL